jgi:hypothetical protein
MSRNRLALVAVSIAVLLGVVAATRTSSAGSATAPAHQISVNGNGSVEAVPDQVAFTFGVQTSAKTASAALSANAAAATKVIAALKAAGIAAKDIQTQQVSLSQRLSDDGQTLLGYNASSSVAATLPSITKAGEVIDGAVAAGADSVDGPALTLSNEKALEQKALASAVQDAKARAQALATAAGVSLGSIVAITESGASTPIPFASAKAADAAGTPVPVEPGTQEVQAFVSVTFATT